MRDHVPRLAHPVVLVHGLCGFDRIFACRRPVMEYFPGIRPLLESAGNRVLTPRLSPTAGVAIRAAELAAYIRREVGTTPVHVIGHSMGGLDARYMIARLGLDAQVKSLTTLGTPHRGTAFADWGIDRFSRTLRPLFCAAGVSDGAFLDLTTDACKRFNETVPNVPGVRYFSVAGDCGRDWLGAEWAMSSRIVARSEGPNDGVVSVASAAWGGACCIKVGATIAEDVTLRPGSL